jgi:hypothetical protein
MQQRCCCYQCKQDPYNSLWMRCSSVSRFFRGTRQTRLNLHHLHSLLKQTLGRRRANKRVLIGEREREREKQYVCMYVLVPWCLLSLVSSSQNSLHKTSPDIGKRPAGRRRRPPRSAADRVQSFFPARQAKHTFILPGASSSSSSLLLCFPKNSAETG